MPEPESSMTWSGLAGTGVPSLAEGQMAASAAGGAAAMVAEAPMVETAVVLLAAFRAGLRTVSSA